MKHPDTVDPMRHGLVEELRALRRGHGEIGLRLGALPWITDTLGRGSWERAAIRLEELRERYAADPETDVGAFFWLAEYGIQDASASLERRLDRYGEQFACHPRTGLRRSDDGIDELAGMLRDYSESERPTCMINLWQSGASATVVLDFWMSRESSRVPLVQINGEQRALPELLWHHHEGDPDGRVRTRLVFDDLPLALDAEIYEPCLHVRVIWNMPISPVWQLTGWPADPRFAVRLQTFRERAAEADLIIRAL